MNRIVNKGIEIKGLVRSDPGHFERVIELIQNANFASKVKRLVSNKVFVVKAPQDLQSAFEYADTENYQGQTTMGRILVSILPEES